MSEEQFDFGTGIHVITITYNDDATVLPEVDLGDCSPWIAITLLKSAIDTIDLVIPPMNVTYKGDKVIEHDHLEGEDLYGDENE